MTARRMLFAAAIAGVLAVTPAVHAYLKLGYYIGTQLVGLQWTGPVRYFVTNRDVPGVTATQLQSALDRAFTEWGRPANVQLSSQFAGLTGIEPGTDDGVTTIGFRAHTEPEFARTLGATTFEFDAVTDRFIGADIFLNSIFDWSVAANGDSARFDVESILVHEVGHLLGLGHSALGETAPRAGGGRTVLGKWAVMFPIAYPRGSIQDRTLDPDDIAGITDIYGTSEAQRTLGAIAGRVTLDARGVFGAHITAFNLATGDLISGFSLDTRGEFVISSIPPGVYIVRAEPLDDADIDGFFDEDSGVDLNFRVAYYPRQVAVPPGGTSGSIEIRVKTK